MEKILTALQMMAPNIMLGISMILVIILSFVNRKKHGLSKTSTVLFILSGYPFAVMCAMLMGSLYGMVSQSYGGEGSRLALFGSIVGMPFFIFVSMAFGKDWRQVADLFSPGVFIALAFSKFGCFIYGCCPGIECDFGVYNRLHDKIMFPSQLFESITMCLVVAFGYWYNYKYKKKTPGTVYPVITMVYTATRFFWEFFRYYDIEKMRHMFLGLSFWQLWCIGLFVVCALLIVLFKNPKFVEKEAKYYAWHKIQLEKLKGKLGSTKKADKTA